VHFAKIDLAAYPRPGAQTVSATAGIFELETLGRIAHWKFIGTLSDIDFAPG
jgi:hypothetical protein